MKKTLTLAAIFIAIASYGGSTLLAHAQSLTPAEAAADQQELAVLKAQLIQLQMEEGVVPVGDAGAPAVTPAPQVTSTPTSAPTSMMLSASDVASINTALNALKSALVALQSDVANNPQILTTNGQGVANVLGGINATLASINSEVQNGSIAMSAPTQPSQSSGGQAPTTAMSEGSGSMTSGSGIAQSNPSAAATAPTANQTAPVATTPSTAATTPAPTVAITPSVNTAPQTAQAASSFSPSKLNWPLIIVIILIVAAIAIWLWWDDGDETKAKPIVKNVSSAPQRPAAPIVQITNNAPAATPTAQPTPMSSVVSTNPQPQQQIRKPA